MADFEGGPEGMPRVVHVPQLALRRPEEPGPVIVNPFANSKAGGTQRLIEKGMVDRSQFQPPEPKTGEE